MQVCLLNFLQGDVCILYLFLYNAPMTGCLVFDQSLDDLALSID